MAQLTEAKAKRILATEDIAVPFGEALSEVGKVAEIFRKINRKTVIKAQIPSTSRFASGGIKFADSAIEAENLAEEMLGREIDGNLCEQLLLEEKLDIKDEFYLGFIIDNELKRPLLLFSEVGGSGIEERSATIKKLVCSVRHEPKLAEIKSICPREEIAEILLKLYRVAKKNDARTAEINPLAELQDGRLIALDCRISVDDYAVFRHEDLGIEIARELGHTPTKLEKIAWKVEKDDFRGTFFFVEILQNQAEDFKIGFHGAGGGGSMASLDAAQRHGLFPACYVDTSGNPPASKVYRATKIILSIPEIRGYFLSGSGVASQEQFVLARAVLKAFLEEKPLIPAVLRLGGNGEDLAKNLVERYAELLPLPIEAYRKKDSADDCAKRLHELINNLKTNGLPKINDKLSEARRLRNFSESYSFRTKTGRVSFDYSKLDEESAKKIVEACPPKILKLNEKKQPVLAIEAEEAERGKCSECLACEFVGLDLGLQAVKIDFPIEDLE